VLDSFSARKEKKLVKTIFAVVLSVGLFGAVASAQPNITQVTNAASFLLPPLPGSSIAQGSFIAIIGTGLGASATDCGAGFAACLWPSSYPLPTSITAGSTTTTVQITVGGTTTNAIIYLAYENQVNAVVPSSTPTGSGTVTVKVNGTASNAFPITVVQSSFATFAINSAGTGPGIVTDVDYSVFTPTHTAKPGDAVILWGTGLGPSPDVANEGMTGPCPSGCDFTKSGYTVNVFVGGIQANVAYAGRAPGLTALDQVVFTVPSNVGTGCYVTVAVQASAPGGAAVISNFTSMAIDSNGGTCSDADGVNMNDLEPKLSAGSNVNVGVVSLLSNYVPLDIGGGVMLQFDNDTVNAEIATFTPGVIDAFQGFALAPSAGSCIVSPFLEFPPPADPELSTSVLHYLNAGTTLSINGGETGMQSIPMNSNGEGYGALVGGASIANLLSGGGLQPYFLPSSLNSLGMWQPSGIAQATYTVSGPGGSDVGAFSGNLTVSSQAAAFQWNQPASGATIPRDTPLTITWTGGDNDGFVDITIISSTVVGLLPSATTPGMLAECFAPASAGSFTIPTYVLQALPSTLNSSGQPNSNLAGELLVGPASGAQKVSPTPSGLDALYLLYHYISGVPVSWK
jgi:uncharacterized protein (TIGR03437 family)